MEGKQEELGLGVGKPGTDEELRPTETLVRVSSGVHPCVHRMLEPRRPFTELEKQRLTDSMVELSRSRQSSSRV